MKEHDLLKRFKLKANDESLDPLFELVLLKVEGECTAAIKDHVNRLGRFSTTILVMINTIVNHGLRDATGAVMASDFITQGLDVGFTLSYISSDAIQVKSVVSSNGMLKKIKTI